MLMLGLNEALDQSAKATVCVGMEICQGWMVILWNGIVLGWQLSSHFFLFWNLLHLLIMECILLQFILVYLCLF